jgi:hypothetical protein
MELIERFRVILITQFEALYHAKTKFNTRLMIYLKAGKKITELPSPFHLYFRREKTSNF